MEPIHGTSQSRGAKMLSLIGITLQRETGDANWKIKSNTDNNTAVQETSGSVNLADDEIMVINDMELEAYCNDVMLQNDDNIVITTWEEIETSSLEVVKSVQIEESKQSNNLSENDSSSTSSSDDDFVVESDYESNLSTSSSSSSSVGGKEIAAPVTSLPNHIEPDIDRKKTRKRKSIPSEWKRNKAKKLRNSGQAYRTILKGKLVNEREMGVPCKSNCKFSCSNKFSEEERAVIFTKYWNFSDITTQRTFISTLMQEISPKYTYPVLVNGKRKRTHNNAFYFEKDDKKIRVCKIFFISTLGITQRCIRSVIKKRKEGSFEEKRGKHGKQPHSDNDVKNKVRAHIASIPKIESHYTRAHSQKEYIEGGKTIVDLYKDYKADCEKNGENFASLSMYRNIFNYEFNLAFFIPKKDQCQKCAAYDNAGEEERRGMEEDYLCHQRQKDLSRKEKQEDKDKICEKYLVACFDLQATLPTPRGNVSTFYYRSKLSTYNFTVCDLQKKGQGNVVCFMWYEGQGKRGPNEIGSCLLKYLKDKSETLNIDDLDIVFYSDNCAGQQKNKFVLAAYFYAVSKYKIKSITHKYLVTGHTQNEGDNVHSVIEKNITRSLKSGPIYTPEQYVELVKTAKKTGTPYKVVEMSYNDFYDLKKLTAQVPFNFSKDNSGEPVKLSEASVIQITKEHLDRFYYKTSFEEPFRTVVIKGRNTRGNNNVMTFDQVQLQSAYKGPIPIPKKKYEDLMYLLNSNVIKKCHSHFYNSLKPAND